MKLPAKRALVLFIAAFALDGCAASVPPLEPTDTPAPGGPIHSTEGGVVEGPQGAALDIPASALNQDAQVMLETADNGLSIPDASLLNPASMMFMVDLGGASLVAQAVMMIPLDSGAGDPSDMAFLGGQLLGGAGWRVFGVEVKNGQASFPILHPGSYQIFQFPFPGSGSPERLHVPAYLRWGDSPWGHTDTILTELAQYHTGAWPAGGVGAQLGETDRWYIAGKAYPVADPFNVPGILGALGFPYAGDPIADPPEQGLTTPEVEVIVWEISSDAEINLLWPALQAYLHGYLTGLEGAPRPVGWVWRGGISELMAGSDGSSFLTLEVGGSDLASFTINAISTPWDEWHALQIDSTTPQSPNSLQTVVFLTSPRPEAQRRGVLWLKPWHENPEYENASLVLRRGPNHDVVSHWNHDIVLSHGYSYDDALDQLPDDPEFGNAFTVLSDEDDLKYWFLVGNISDQPYEYHADVELFHESDASGEILLTADLPFIIDPMAGYGPFEDTIPLAGKELGLYTLKFTLSQGGVIQDVKYLQFRLAEALIEPAPIPSLIPLPNFNPDPGPLFSTDRLFTRGQSCGPSEVMVDASFPDYPGANVVLFFRFKGNDGTPTSWNSQAMTPLGGGMFTRTLDANADFEGTAAFMEGSLQLQFVLTDATGKVLGRSDVFTDLMVMICRA